MAQCDIGFVGLGVMGKSLTLNLADNGFQVAAFDLDAGKVDAAMTQDQVENNGVARVQGCSSFGDLLAKVKAPRTIVLSVPAGAPVDSVCRKLIEAGIGPDDTVVDTGNSLWSDTVRREKKYAGLFMFFSTAVSGGEAGARFGPSLMPSGDERAWQRIKPMWQAIAAKVDPQTGKPIEGAAPGKPITEGEPCAEYIGPNGAGHYVKMVHNGIEYADMQLICEAYHVMRDALDMTPKAIAEVFRQWNQGVLDSYLMEISVEVLEQQDSHSGQPLVDVIMDRAGQKGTGMWTAMSSLELAAPAPTITAAVYARAMSAMKTERVAAAKVLRGPQVAPMSEQEKAETIAQLHDALYCSKICAYAQGFQLMSAAAKANGWKLDFIAIAKIWRAGCIIRAVFLQSIADAYGRDQELANLLVDQFFAEQIESHQGNWRMAIAKATMMGIPVGAFSSALSYYDAYRLETLPANLLQGQRDFFGAHTFERTDQPAGEMYHVEWGTAERKMVKM
ncbi:NADP-dependent phosphogluconate dehydrogenase [Ferrimonas marina]|uniref:6-phosphogluconate dehydrogenase, decarboxylating n=1 Tax=Ferrimonas marina TaxID=299255 RepID=A0A1M5X4M4_9GAMM|nr:NADP-dependent phosphogluconate dehydrogenase [Ferrimonas marina]SHH94474.1 6-phosphogluconate dehydrogenase [Ferrimonas marina]